MTDNQDGDVCDVFVPQDQQDETALLGVVGPPVSYSEFLDTPVIPGDAGEYEEGLRKILSRIPSRWGRWISCDKGWYPLIVELNEKLEKIAPEYTIHQVKEKFGTLRYYIGFPDLKAQCCIDVENTQPYPGEINPRWMSKEHEGRTLQQQYELDKWFYNDLLKHYDTPEHEEGEKSLEPEYKRQRKLLDQMYPIIEDYEERSSKICEVCSYPGTTKARNYWYKTLCSVCAEIQKYTDIPTKDEEQQP